MFQVNAAGKTQLPPSASYHRLLSQNPCHKQLGAAKGEVFYRSDMTHIEEKRKNDLLDEDCLIGCMLGNDQGGSKQGGRKPFWQGKVAREPSPTNKIPSDPKN